MDILSANCLVGSFFSGRLVECKTAFSYLANKRRLSPEVISEFGFGWSGSHAEVAALLASYGVAGDTAIRYGLAKRDSTGELLDRFRNRVILPIHDEQGRLVGFVGRTLSDEIKPKYLNSPDTEVYSKRETLFNLNRAIPHIGDTGFAIAVEGHMDTVSVWAADTKNVVALSGTAFTVEQARLLYSYAPDVVLCLDTDDAGIEATRASILQAISVGLFPWVMTVEGKDPDEFIHERGAAAFSQRVAARLPYLTWAVNTIRAKFACDTPEGRMSAVEWLVPMLAHSGSESVSMAAQALSVPPRLLGELASESRRAGVDKMTLGQAVAVAKKSRN